MTTNTPLDEINLLDSQFLRDPYPTYRRLQTEAPICWNKSIYHWIFTRYKDALAILRDPRFSAARCYHGLPKSVHKYMAYFLKQMSQWMLFLDRPQHTRIRSLISSSFTPNESEKMRPRIQEIVDQLIDDVYERGQIDIIWDLSYPLPAIVTGEILGTPRQDRDLFKVWTSDIVLSGYYGTPERWQKAQESMKQAVEYFRGIARQRRQNPQDDLISKFIAAKEEGQTLSDEEIASQCVLMIIGGYETTQNLIGNTMLLLHRHPTQRQKLQGDFTLIKGAIEESLRCEGPVQCLNRIALEDIEMEGHNIKKGDGVMVVLGAANRDPEIFPDPDRFDITRDPNPHITMGSGIHYCLGAPLGRLEAQIAVETLLRRMPTIHLADEKPQWMTTNCALRGLKSLPMVF